MTDEKNVEIWVTIGPDRIQLVLPGDGWTSDEAKLAKRASEGMAPAVIEDNLLLMDPDAWAGVLRVSYMRADKDYPAQAIGNTDLTTLLKALSDQIKEAMKDRPPTSASANGSTALEEKPQPEPTEDPSSESTTSETSGVPT